MQARWHEVISTEFWRDFAALPSDITQRAKRAIDRMLQDPWAPELEPEKVKSAESGVHSCRADDNYRIIWKYIKPNNIVFLLIDKHDSAYRRAARKSFVLDSDNVIHVADIVEAGAQTTQATGALFEWARKADAKYGTLFLGYRDQDLLDMGIPEDVLPNIRALDDTQQLEQVEPLVPEATFWKLMDIVTATVERPVVPDSKLNESLQRFQGGDELYLFVDSDEFKRALEGNMEEWMLFLAPFQRSLTLREYNGPARVRGVAGSGKTVIALHRARFLTRKLNGVDRKVLFLTFGNRLPGMNSHLFARLTGQGLEMDRFQCLTFHQLCGHLLNRVGAHHDLNPEVSSSALVHAIGGVRSHLNLPKLFGRPTQFFQDEISYAIKGRNVRTLDEYLRLNRTGRGTALNPAERQAMFAVYESYQNELGLAGKCDWDDLILQTLQLLESGKIQGLPYAHIVVDEIQDLSEASMRLVRLLVPPSENDLFLVGDGMQRIYPGGYALARLGIDITGRSTLLRRNYRNTQQILRAAHAVIEKARFDDMEENEENPAVEPEYSVRQGAVPSLKGFVSPDMELQRIAKEISRLRDETGYQPGDVAILYRHSSPYKELIPARFQSSFPISEITKEPASYFGPALKYTTFHSSKGLEFKVVFVVGVTDALFVPKDDGTLEGEELADYLERERRLLYVAMTRARDLLYLTYSRGQPSRFLERVPPEFIRR
jgi:superfamily I DNA/RNA helicase/mRNA-degrading endonuclease RelE of RelBE toxin-antitoxin system